MKVSFSLCLLLTYSFGQLGSGAQCNNGGPRRDCGYLGINQQQCEAKGCCWNPADSSVPWCFYSNGNEDSQCRTDQPRVDCGRLGTTQSECENHGCCWSPGQNEAYCFFPTPSYVVQSVNQTALGFTMTIMNKLSSGVAGAAASPISPLTVEVTQETNDRLHIKIYDPNSQRWEVPTRLLPVPAAPSSPPPSLQYSFILPNQGETFSFAVLRKSDNQSIFDTRNAGYFSFADQLLSIATTLQQDHNIYGLGEHKTQLRLKPQMYTLWSFDTPTPENLNLYGSHPFYLEVSSATGNAHGVFLRNSNGMDIILGSNSLRYNVIGGILDFYFFLGPEPEAVIQQYQEVIGRPHMPPYWGLGFHQCRYGFHDLQEVEDVVTQFAVNGIPLDTMWTDIDYMYNYKDFTVDPNRFSQDQFSQFIDKLHASGRHYVVIIDPGINNAANYKPYQDGVAQDIFIKDSNNDVFIGKVWPGYTAFPDFLNPMAVQYWQKQIGGFLQMIPVDGLWIDMNEPSNFCNGECKGLMETTKVFIRNTTKVFIRNTTKPLSATRVQTLTDPPYYINNQGSKAVLNTKTVDPDAVQGGTTHYNAHNLFGFTEAIATRTALENIRQNVRSFIISRSTFPGSGVHTGHWTGDNSATAQDMYFSIPGILSFQMFGVPLVGSDICGFLGDTTEELCSRWMELGAFYPFSRNHNTKGAMSQEPYRWSSVANISKNVLGIRYSLLPYYYTLFYKAHRSVDSSNPPAATVVRPLFFEFPKDSMTYSIDKQFLVGSGILISPQLNLGDQGKSLDVYFPQGKWYDWYTHQVVSANGGETKTFDTPVDVILIHLRGGTVIPMQKPGNTTTESRKKDYSLLVVLNAIGEASGDLFLDDGVSIDIESYTYVQYSVSKNVLSATVTGTGYASANLPPLGTIKILGVPTQPNMVKLNGVTANNFKYDSNSHMLELDNIGIKMDDQLSLMWG